MYLESSAAVSWLLDEPMGPRVEHALRAADRICTSELTLVECHRVFRRAVAAGHLTEAEGARCRSRVDKAACAWMVSAITEPICARARGAFPHEPVRALDALHLATLLQLSESLGALTVVSLDGRVRTNARELGFALLPDVDDEDAS